MVPAALQPKSPVCSEGMMLPSVLTASCCTCQTGVPGSEILKLDSQLAKIRIVLIDDVWNGGNLEFLNTECIHF